MRVTWIVLLVAGLAMAQGRHVIVLGEKQFLPMGKAYDSFCRKNKGRKRSELREATLKELKRIAAAEQSKLLEALGNPKDARSLWLVNAVVVQLTEEQIENARGLATVKYVYPAGRIPLMKDPGRVGTVLERAKQPPFSPKGKKIPWNLKGLRVPEAWKLGAHGDGVVVAMFDAGANYTQPDLRRNIWINANEVPNNGKDDDKNGVVDDYYGFDFARMRCEVAPGPRGQNHGTWTSSVVAGDGTGGTVTGVAPRARLMPLVGFGGAYNAARAFQYALEQGADVVNMSFSQANLGDTRGLWRLMAEHASAAGLVLVSGAGNFPRQKVPVQIRIPEGIPCVICVGGVTKKLEFADFTSQGPVEWKSVKFYGDFAMPKGLVKPDVCAFPGPRIALVAASGEGYLPKNNGKRGNSLSAPHVTGVIALMLSVNPELTPWRVKEILEQTAKDLAPRGKDNRTGAGLVRADRAVKAAMK